MDKKRSVWFVGKRKTPYIEMNVHQRINAKSWVKELCLLAYGSVVKTLLLADDLPGYIRQNIGEQCDRETRMYRKNWRI